MKYGESSPALCRSHLLLYRIPSKITIRYRGKKAQYDMHWDSTVREMKKEVMKNEGVGSELVELVYDRKKLYNRDKWYSTSLLGKEDIVLHLCKT